MDLEPPEDAEHDPVLVRAAEAIERADATLAEPRPFAAALREAQERAAIEREEEEKWQRRAKPAAAQESPPAPSSSFEDNLIAAVGRVFGAARRKTDERIAELEKRIAAPPSFDGDSFGDKVVEAVKGYVERQNAPLRARIAALESRLAQSEGRLAGVESKASKRK